MSQRIFNCCRRVFSQPTEFTAETFAMIAENVQAYSDLVERILHDSNLEIANRETAMEFCSAKVKTSLTPPPLFMHYISFPSRLLPI